MKHTCKAPNCPEQISERFLMCSRHWALVPRGIQIRVHRAWRALNQGQDPENIATYQAVVSEAIRSVTPEPNLQEIEQRRRYMRERMSTATRKPDGSVHQPEFPC